MITTNALIVCLFIIGCGLVLFIYYDYMHNGYMQMISGLIIIGGLVGLFVSQPISQQDKH